MLYEQINFDLSLIDERIKYLLAYAPYNPDVIIFGEIKAKIIGFTDFTDNNPVRVITEDNTIIDVMLSQIKIRLKPLSALEKDFFVKFYGVDWKRKATINIIKNEIRLIYYSCLANNLRQDTQDYLLRNHFDIYDLFKKGLAVDYNSVFPKSSVL